MRNRCASSIACRAGTFESLKEDVHSGLIDVCDAGHADGDARVKQFGRFAPQTGPRGVSQTIRKNDYRTDKFKTPPLCENSCIVPDEGEPGWALNKMTCVL